MLPKAIQLGELIKKKNIKKKILLLHTLPKHVNTLLGPGGSQPLIMEIFPIILYLLVFMPLPYCLGVGLQDSRIQ